MGTPRYGHAFTADDNYVYAISGYHYESFPEVGDTIHTTLNTIERYDVEQGSWGDFETDNIIARRYGDAEHNDGFIYVFGGQTSEEHVGLVERIDTQNGNIYLDNPYHVWYGASAEWEDEIYIWGGRGEVDGEYKNSTYKLNLFTGEWTQLADYPQFVNSLEGVAVDGYIYSFGGYGGSENGVSDEIYRYNIAEDFWEFMGNTDIPVSSHSVAADYETGNIVITGGYAELTYSAVYDVEHNDYHRVENFDFIGRRHSGSVFLGETLFTFGGAQPEGYNENEDYITLNSVQFGYMDYDEADGPETCELLNCDNLHFVHVMDSTLLHEISNTLGVSDTDAFNMVVNEEIEMWVFDFGQDPDEFGPHYQGRFMTEYNHPDDTLFYYAAEYPDGIPESRVHYYWVWGTVDSASGEFVWGEGEYIDDPAENCLSMAPEPFDMPTRFWDPEQYQSGWEYPEEFWNFDFWNSCEYFNGPSNDVVYFEKMDNADWTVEDNQDRIMENIWITRAYRGHMFNVSTEDEADDNSPDGTVWAQGSTEEQSSLENYGPLKEVVVEAYGGFAYIVGEVFSLYLPEYDEYYDVVFESWTNGNNGGGFSYTRYGVDAPAYEEDVVFLGSFDGSEYFQVNEFVSWEVANEIAMNFAPGSHLATLTTPEENEFVRSRVNWDFFGEYYMGLVDVSQNGEGWSWVTGEPLDWVNWDDGQPDSPGNQNFGVLWPNGKWDDGDAEMPFIVEIPQGPPGMPVEVTASSFSYR